MSHHLPITTRRIGIFPHLLFEAALIDVLLAHPRVPLEMLEGDPAFRDHQKGRPVRRTARLTSHHTTHPYTRLRIPQGVLTRDGCTYLSMLALRSLTVIVGGPSAPSAARALYCSDMPTSLHVFDSLGRLIGRDRDVGMMCRCEVSSVECVHLQEPCKIVYATTINLLIAPPSFTP